MADEVEEEPGRSRSGSRLPPVLCMGEVAAGWFGPPARLLTAPVPGWGAALVATVPVALLERPVPAPG